MPHELLPPRIRGRPWKNGGPIYGPKAVWGGAARASMTPGTRPIVRVKDRCGTRELSSKRETDRGSITRDQNQK